MKSNRSEVATINLVQTQVKEMYFIFNLECRRAALSKGIPHILPIKSQCSTKPKNSSEMSETQYPHTLHISLNQEKSDGSVFQTGGFSFGCNGYISVLCFSDCAIISFMRSTTSVNSDWVKFHSWVM
jgi:hypothetical protein